jgi:hypothetical protein
LARTDFIATVRGHFLQSAMTKLLAGLLMASVLTVGGEARAAEMFIDGAVAQAAFNTCVTGSPTTLVAGYVVDPALELPRIGDGTVLHGMARANANCGDDITLEFFIPPGAHFDASRSVVCNIISSTNVVTPLPVGGPNFCRQISEAAIGGAFGGRVFGRLSGLSLGNTFEVRVPIVFDQQFDDTALGVSANTLFGGIHANVLANAPFQPALNQFAIGEDIGLLGSSDVGLPVAFSNGDGSFTVTTRGGGDFPAWSRTPGVQRLSGDFNRDGLLDYALVGGPNWQSIPVAFSDGNGKFTITNSFVGSFGNMFGAASHPNAKAVAGDFNRDGYTDIALVGGTGWMSIPVAFNTGNGNFSIKNEIAPLFPQLATIAGARPIAGDFNKDGMTDIALVGGAGANTIPVAFSFGNGFFQVTNQTASSVFCGIVCNGANFPFLASLPGTKVVAGDFNKDGYTDLALAGAPGGFPGSSSIVTALSASGGTFQIRTANPGDFATTAARPGAKLLTGDFNKDGYTDLVLAGQGGSFMPVAFSTNSGNFSVANFLVNDFGSWAASPNVKIVMGDYNGDGYTDVALVGGVGWASIPVAFSVGGGIWNITNRTVNRMPARASEVNTTAFAGHVDWN